jgi:hypothetical protein
MRQGLLFPPRGHMGVPLRFFWVPGDFSAITDLPTIPGFETIELIFVNNWRQKSSVPRIVADK